MGGNGTMVERVVTSKDVLLGTDVNIPRESGTKNATISHLVVPKEYLISDKKRKRKKGISDFVSSGCVVSLSSNGSDHLIKPPLLLPP